VKLAVLTAGVWPTEEEARRKLWIFLASCKKFGIEPLLYGVGTKQFPGYRAMMLDMQLDYLKTMSGYTHVLFTDALDAFFTAGLDEIQEKYKRMGSPPILCSAFFQLGNVSDEEKDYPGCFDHTIRYRYPNRGGYIAEIPAIIEAFERMLAQDGLTGDDCFEWYRGWKEGWFRPMLDSRCEIFQIAEDDISVLHITKCENGKWSDVNRLVNLYTTSEPCILHLSGGFTDQSSGKDERMLPWARRLGIVEPERLIQEQEK